MIVLHITKATKSTVNHEEISSPGTQSIFTKLHEPVSPLRLKYASSMI